MCTTTPGSTAFRAWMMELRKREGDRPDWPLLLCWMLEAEFLRQQQAAPAYTGKAVFMDRDDDDPTRATSPEKKAVRDLYHLCRRQTARCLTVGNECYWLLGYEWPNQGNYRMRRADLVGLSEEGGLIVFEAKLKGNKDPPVTALVEGLDYLSCLTGVENFSRIQEGFWVWRERTDFQVPKGFEESEPSREAKHAVILLAPQGYYNLYGQPNRSNRGRGWKDLARVARQACDRIELGFAVSDFQQTTASWAEIG